MIPVELISKDTSQTVCVCCCVYDLSAVAVLPQYSNCRKFIHIAAHLLPQVKGKRRGRQKKRKYNIKERKGINKGSRKKDKVESVAKSSVVSQRI